jgi:hypothetical protein
MAWLPAHMPDSARDASKVSVVHGDYRLDNLVFHPEEPRVLAVLDWELSTLGHPLADFSYHCMAWHIPPGAFRGIGGLDLASLGIPPEADYVSRWPPTGPSTSPTTCFAWPRSCKALPSGSKTAPPRAPRRARPAPGRDRWPSSAGASRKPPPDTTSRTRRWTSPTPNEPVPCRNA